MRHLRLADAVRSCVCRKSLPSLLPAVANKLRSGIDVSEQMRAAVRVGCLRAAAPAPLVLAAVVLPERDVRVGIGAPVNASAKKASACLRTT